MSREHRSVKSFNRRLALHGLVAAAILFFIPAVASAATNTYYWQVDSGDWSTASNWGGMEPTSSDYADVNNGGTVTITKTREYCKYLSLGSASATTGTVQMTDGNLTTYYN
jgi:hypothetical protein